MTAQGEPAGGSRVWNVLAGAWSIAPALLVYWLLTTSTAGLRDQLKSLQFWSLEACVFLLAACVVGVGREVKERVTPRDAATAAALAIAAFTLTLTLPARTSRIYYDEQIYQNVGQNLADLRLAQVCNDGAAQSGRLQCWSGEYNKQPYAYPHLLSLVYRAIGTAGGAAVPVNAFVMAVTTALLFLFVTILLDDRGAAFMSGLLFLTVPEQLMWSATAAVEPSASMAQVAAWFFAALYARSGSLRALLATAVSTAYAMQFRPESLLLLPVVALIAAPRAIEQRREPGPYAALLLFFTLSAVHVAHLAAVRDIGWGTSAERFSLRFVGMNLRVNGRFFLGDERFPFLYSVLALFGVGFGHRLLQRERLAMALHFLLFFAIDLIFYAGSYNYGADVRYSLMTYPSLAVLAGLGMAALLRLAPAWHVPLRAASMTALGIYFLTYVPLIRAVPDEAWAARADVRFAQEFARTLPADSYVLTHNPGMFQVWGGNAGQMSRVAEDPGYLRYLSGRFTGGVYLHWNFWCNVRDDVQPAFCRKVIAAAPAELVQEVRERDQRFAFYRLDVPSS